jgi:hypothetical protein
MNTDSRSWALGLLILALFFLYYNRKQLNEVLWGDVVKDYGYTGEKHAEFLERAKKDRANQKKTVITVFVALLIASLGNWFVYQDNKNDYQTAQEAFYYGQVDGFSSGCDELFARYSLNGVLYAYNETYTTQWCKSLFNLSDLGTEYPPKIDFEGYPQPADQYSLGFYEASDELPKVVFTKVPFLCYGVKCANIATFLPSNKINIELPNAIKYGVTD